MVKATRILNPSILKEGDMVLSRHNPYSRASWYTFRVVFLPVRDFIRVYSKPYDRICEGYSFGDVSTFYLLSEEIGWYWGVYYEKIVEAVGCELNLGA